MSLALPLIVASMSLVGMILVFMGITESRRNSKAYNYFCSFYGFVTAVAMGMGVILGGVGWFYLLLVPIWLFIGFAKFYHAKCLCR